MIYDTFHSVKKQKKTPTFHESWVGLDMILWNGLQYHEGEITCHSESELSLLDFKVMLSDENV